MWRMLIIIDCTLNGIQWRSQEKRPGRSKMWRRGEGTQNTSKTLRGWRMGSLLGSLGERRKHKCTTFNMPHLRTWQTLTCGRILLFLKQAVFCISCLFRIHVTLRLVSLARRLRTTRRIFAGECPLNWGRTCPALVRRTCTLSSVYTSICRHCLHTRDISWEMYVRSSACCCQFSTIICHTCIVVSEQQQPNLTKIKCKGEQPQTRDGGASGHFCSLLLLDHTYNVGWNPQL